jgi:hypothetical protein
MSAAVFLLDPAETRRVYPLPFPPRDRDQLAQVLGIFPYAPLEIRQVGADVPGVGAHKDDLRPAALVIACGAQPALPGNEAGVYHVRGVPIVGRSILTAQEIGAAPLGTSLVDRTHFLRLLWSVAEAAALVEWERPTPTADTPKPYDVAALESYLHFACKAAAPVYEGGGCLRLYAIDPFGIDAGAANFLPTDFQGMRRYALDCFDRRQAVQHELAVRATASYASVAETPPIGVWAVPTEKESDADFSVTGSSGQHFAKLTGSRDQTYDKRLVKYKPKRIPLPGVPTWENSSPQLVTWARCAG